MPAGRGRPCAPNRQGRRRRGALAFIVAGAGAGVPVMGAEENPGGENATIAELQQALAEGRTSASALTRAYLARIEAYDRAGPQLNAVREVNPEALAIAAALDRGPASPTPPLAGVPILVKDNIATGDRQHTTAGSLALAEAHATRDAALVAKLRAAGAAILVQATLTQVGHI